MNKNFSTFSILSLMQAKWSSVFPSYQINEILIPTTESATFFLTNLQYLENLDPKFHLIVQEVVSTPPI